MQAKKSSMYRFEITIEKLPIDDEKRFLFIRKHFQKITFNGVFKLIADGFGAQRKGLSESDLSDSKQTIFKLGTKEECLKYKYDFESIERKNINEFIHKIGDIRLLPKSIKRKINAVKFDPDLTTLQLMQGYLAAHSILLTLDVVKVNDGVSGTLAK